MNKLKNCLVFISYASLIGLVFIYFSKQWWIFELATHFYVQYTIILFGSAIIFSMMKKWKTAILFTLIIIFQLCCILPDFFSPSTVPKTQTSKLRLVSYNLLRSNNHYSKALSFLEKTDSDFILLLEVTPEWEKALLPLKTLYPYQKGLSRLDSFGIWLFSRHSFVSAEILYFGKNVKNSLPSIIVEIQHEQQKFTIIGTHPLPPRTYDYAFNRNVQLQKLSQKIATMSKPIVVAGDLNVTPWSPYFIDFLHISKLKDTRKGYGLQASWPSSAFLLWIPIDHCLVSSDIKIHRRFVGVNCGSDHYPIIIDFSLPVVRNF